MYEMIFNIISDGRHLIVLGPDGQPVCMNICIHDDDFQEVYNRRSDAEITALTLTRIAKEFNDQAQRINGKAGLN